MVAIDKEEYDLYVDLSANRYVKFDLFGDVIPGNEGLTSYVPSPDEVLLPTGRHLDNPLLH